MVCVCPSERDSELASSSESGSVADLIPCGGCVFCRTHLNTSTNFRSSVTGKQFTLSSNEIPNTLACTSKNVIYLITCDKCCIQYVGMTTTNIRTRFYNHRSCMKNYKRNILLYDHFCGPGHEMSHCKVQIIFHVKQMMMTQKMCYWPRKSITCGCSLLFTRLAWMIM